MCSGLRDRAVGGGFALMLLNATVVFGTFVLTSLYLQGVLATGPLETGLEFLPLATAAAVGAHLGARLAARFGLRPPMAAGFAAAAAGALLLSGAGRGGSYPADVLPACSSPASDRPRAPSVLGGVREDEAGMLSGGPRRPRNRWHARDRRPDHDRQLGRRQRRRGRRASGDPPRLPGRKRRCRLRQRASRDRPPAGRAASSRSYGSARPRCRSTELGTRSPNPGRQRGSDAASMSALLRRPAWPLVGLLAHFNGIAIEHRTTTTPP
jgi:hypothetical protein